MIHPIRYEIIATMFKENLDRLNKDITYVVSLIVKNKLFYLSNKVSRNKLIQVYNDCKKREEKIEARNFK